MEGTSLSREKGKGILSIREAEDFQLSGRSLSWRRCEALERGRRVLCLLGGGREALRRKDPDFPLHGRREKKKKFACASQNEVRKVTGSFWRGEGRR